MTWVRVQIRLVILTFTLSLTVGYPGGAPEESCTNMVPNHGGNAQTDKSPFTIQVSSLNYTVCGPPLTVTLFSTTTANFLGFLVTARRANSGENQNIGTFIATSVVQKICSDQAATHKTNYGMTTIKVQWTPPSTNEGPLIFKATFVKSRYTYWTGLTSDVITALNPSANISCLSSSADKSSLTLIPHICVILSLFVSFIISIVFGI